MLRLYQEFKESEVAAHWSNVIRPLYLTTDEITLPKSFGLGEQGFGPSGRVPVIRAVALEPLGPVPYSVLVLPRPWPLTSRPRDMSSHGQLDYSLLYELWVAVLLA